MSPFPPDVREAIERGEVAEAAWADIIAEDEVADIDLDAELEALFADGLTFEPRTNRAQRRKAARNRTVFETSWRGSKRRWKPTQTPVPVRIAERRRRNKVARASRKVNR